MSISPISYNYTNLNNNYVHKVNQNTSFCGGGKTTIVKNAHNTGCFTDVLLLIALLPLALIGILSSNTRNKKIDSMTQSIKHGYEAHVGGYEHFEHYVDAMNEFLDKYSINQDYSQFTKDALDFLRINFKNDKGLPIYRERRMVPFQKNNDNLEWYKFINTINISAKAAISKKYKNIDIEKLDNDIKEARELMQNYMNKF